MLATEELKSTSLSSLAAVTVRLFRLFFLDFFLLLEVESVSFTRFGRFFFLPLLFLEVTGDRDRDRDLDLGLFFFLVFRADLGDRFLFFGDFERSRRFLRGGERDRFLKGDRVRFLRNIGDLERWRSLKRSRECDRDLDLEGDHDRCGRLDRLFPRSRKGDLERMGDLLLAFLDLNADTGDLDRDLDLDLPLRLDLDFDLDLEADLDFLLLDDLAARFRFITFRTSYLGSSF